MKLADELIRGSQPPEWLTDMPGDVDTVQRLTRSHLISGVPIIDVTNVADYVWRQKEHWSTTDKDEFPCLAPPAPTFWTEYRRPSVFVHERDDLKDPDGFWATSSTGRRLGGRWVEADTGGWMIERYGALWDSVDLRTGSLDDLPLQFNDQNDLSDVLSRWVPEGAQWFLRGTLYIKRRGQAKPEGPMAFWIGALDEHGILMKDAALGMPYTSEMDPEQHFFWKTMLLPTFMPMLRAVCYMHCKNIEQATHRPPEKLSKKYKKRSGRPLLTFRTLVIDPLVKGGFKSGKTGGGGQKSHHFVRGHFADYREKGLFGRHKAIYWFDMHARGSREVGEVLGDYEVHAPEEDTA